MRAQIYNQAKNGWTSLPEAFVQPMLTADAQGMYRQDNHGWLFAWSNATVFQVRDGETPLYTWSRR